MDLSDPQKDEDAGAAIGEPQASGMRPQASLSSSTQARPTMSTSAPRIVSGFGAERCEDVDAQRRRLDREESSRAAVRRDDWQRGRARDFQDRDLDRGAGGPWHAGR